MERLSRKPEISVLPAEIPRLINIDNIKCRTIMGSDMRIVFDSSDPVNTFKVRCRSGEILQSNTCDHWDRMKVKPGTNYFLIDQYDVHRMTRVFSECHNKEEENQKRDELLSSVTEFSKDFKKNIYVRMIPPTTRDAMTEYRAFVEEALEVIPIVLRRQNKASDVEDLKNRLKTYESQWIPAASEFHNTINMETFEKLLQEFGMDSSLITLVHDPLFELSRQIYIENGGHIVTYTPNMQLVTDSYKSINYVFVKLIMGVNWSSENCQNHQECNRLLKKRIVELIDSYLAVPKANYIQAVATMNHIDHIANLCPAKYQIGTSTLPDYHFKKYKPSFLLKAEDVPPAGLDGEILVEMSYRDVMIDCLLLTVPSMDATLANDFLEFVANGCGGTYEDSQESTETSPSDESH